MAFASSTKGMKNVFPFWPPHIGKQSCEKLRTDPVASCSLQILYPAYIPKHALKEFQACGLFSDSSPFTCSLTDSDNGPINVNLSAIFWSYSQRFLSATRTCYWVSQSGYMTWSVSNSRPPIKPSLVVVSDDLMIKPESNWNSFGPVHINGKIDSSTPPNI